MIFLYNIHIFDLFAFYSEKHSLSWFKGVAKNAVFVSYGNAVGFGIFPRGSNCIEVFQSRSYVKELDGISRACGIVEHSVGDHKAFVIEEADNDRSRCIDLTEVAVGGIILAAILKASTVNL